MHNLQLSEDQDLIVDTVRKYVADAVAPKALEHDEHRVLARAEFDGLAELGLFGLSVAEANGGAGMGLLPFVAALELVGTHSSSLARLLTGQVQAALALEVAGDAALEGLVAGAQLASFVGPEHGLQVAAGTVRGTAELVTAGMPADVVVVAATDGGAPVLAVVDGAAVQRSELRSLGLASSGPARVAFTNAAARIVATGDTAARAIERARLVAWIGTAATCCGGGAESVQAGKRHASQRIAFGKPLLVQEAVLRKLVEAQRQVDAARHLTWHAARRPRPGRRRRGDAGADRGVRRDGVRRRRVDPDPRRVRLHGRVPRRTALPRRQDARSARRWQRTAARPARAAPVRLIG